MKGIDAEPHVVGRQRGVAINAQNDLTARRR